MGTVGVNREVLEVGEVEDLKEGVYLSCRESNDFQIAKGWYRNRVVGW